MLVIPEKFKEYIANLTPNDCVGIIFDGDPDGLTASVIAEHAITKITKKIPEIVFTQGKTHPAIKKETIELIKKHGINKLICLDMALDQSPQTIKETEKIAQILVIDHHKKYEDINSKKTTLIKAGEISKIDGAKYPTSKLVYDLFSDYANLKEHSWVAAVGIIGDNGTNQWSGFMHETIKLHKTSMEELTQLTVLITSIESIAPEKLNELQKEFLNAKEPCELFSSKYFSLKKKLDTELEKKFEEFMQKKEIIPEAELIFFVFTHPYNLKSPLANRVSTEMYPNKTLLIGQIEENHVFFSARRQDGKVAVNNLLEKVTSELEQAHGGGHAPAAAAKIRKQDLNKFRKKIIEELSKSK
jgi:nanoRNase/pAp phosphatase (c-di-AMP/oligoRNAs hydrolase)